MEGGIPIVAVILVLFLNIPYVFAIILWWRNDRSTQIREIVERVGRGSGSAGFGWFTALILGFIKYFLLLPIRPYISGKKDFYKTYKI